MMTSVQQNLHEQIKASADEAHRLYLKRKNWIRDQKKAVDAKYKVPFRIALPMTAMLPVAFVSLVLNEIFGTLTSFIGIALIIGIVGLVGLGIIEMLTKEKYQKIDQHIYPWELKTKIVDITINTSPMLNNLYNIDLPSHALSRSFSENYGMGQFFVRDGMMGCFGPGFVVRRNGEDFFAVIGEDGYLYSSDHGGRRELRDGHAVHRRLPFSDHVVGADTNVETLDEDDLRRLAHDYIVNYGCTDDALSRTPVKDYVTLPDPKYIKDVERLVREVKISPSWDNV